MRYKNNIGPQVRRRRYALGWSQSDLAIKLQLAGFDTSRSGVSKIEARLSYVDDKTMLYLSEVLRVPGAGTLPCPDARKSHPRVHGKSSKPRDSSGNLTRQSYTRGAKRSISEPITAKAQFTGNVVSA